MTWRSYVRKEKRKGFVFLAFAVAPKVERMTHMNIALLRFGPERVDELLLRIAQHGADEGVVVQHVGAYGHGHCTPSLNFIPSETEKNNKKWLGNKFGDFLWFRRSLQMWCLTRPNIWSHVTTNKSTLSKFVEIPTQKNCEFKRGKKEG